MIDWSLAFAAPPKTAIETLAHALAGLCGAPVTTSTGELEGNPRDYYWRSATITGQRGDVTVWLSLSQNFMSVTDENPSLELNDVRFAMPELSFPQMRAMWHALRDALGAIACVDKTLQRREASVIVARMENAGELALATELRAEITEALIAQARTERHVVNLFSARADLEAVLAAYPPDEIHCVHLDDCRIRALPAGIARFPRLADLRIAEPGIDGANLRGWSIPTLRHLSLRDSPVTRVEPADLAGFPNLTDLALARTRVRELDPAIREVCPQLVRVWLDGTPFARDAGAVAALRARWPKVAIMDLI